MLLVPLPIEGAPNTQNIHIVTAMKFLYKKSTRKCFSIKTKGAAINQVLPQVGKIPNTYWSIGLSSFLSSVAASSGPPLFNPIRTEGVSRKHTSYIIDSHVKMSEVNGFFFLDFAN